MLGVFINVWFFNIPKTNEKLLHLKAHNMYQKKEYL